MFLHRFAKLPSPIGCAAFAASMALTMFVASEASAQVYRCQSDNGVPVYQGTPNGRNCQAIDLQPLTTIPSPKLPSSARSPAAGGGAAGAGAAASRGASENFPRVDASVQRSRDSDRRRILEDELKKEEERLGELKSVYKDGEPDRLGEERNYQRYLDRVERLKGDIAQAEGNIASIRRELGTIKD
jgi:hypothetical protein